MVVENVRVLHQHGFFLQIPEWQLQQEYCTNLSIEVTLSLLCPLFSQFQAFYYSVMSQLQHHALNLSDLLIAPLRVILLPQSEDRNMELLAECALYDYTI